MGSIGRAIRVAPRNERRERDSRRIESWQCRKQWRYRVRLVAAILNDRTLMAWIGITVVLVGAGPRSGIRLIVILITMASGCDCPARGWSAGVSQDTRQAQRGRDMKRPASDRKIEHAQNHIIVLSASPCDVNRIKMLCSPTILNFTFSQRRLGGKTSFRTIHPRFHG